MTVTTHYSNIILPVGTVIQSDIFDKGYRVGENISIIQPSSSSIITKPTTYTERILVFRQAQEDPVADRISINLVEGDMCLLQAKFVVIWNGLVPNGRLSHFCYCRMLLAQRLNKSVHLHDDEEIIIMYLSGSQYERVSERTIRVVGHMNMI